MPAFLMIIDGVRGVGGETDTETESSENADSESVILGRRLEPFQGMLMLSSELTLETRFYWTLSP